MLADEVTNRSGTDALIEFYGRDLHEVGRLLRPNSRLEFLRTQELLRARLPPPPAEVVDVGGGSGIHAAWLAEDGYTVTLVDPVPAHVRLARELSAERGLGFTARVGDARDLDLPDESADACLLLGPLYHLPGRRDRDEA
jgi:SAM-dependent methyltransferase